MEFRRVQMRENDKIILMMYARNMTQTKASGANCMDFLCAEYEI